jgi:hypothetical protein
VNDYGIGEPNPSGFDDRGRWFENARASVNTPGLLLQWYGLGSMVLSVIAIGILLIDPDAVFKPVHDRLVKMNREQPAEERKPVPLYDDFVRQQVTQDVIVALVWVFCSALIFYGGSKMKDMRGYGWGIAGSVLAILPCNFCCCIGGLIGAWALVVLLNSDVKLAFSRAPVTLE